MLMGCVKGAPPPVGVVGHMSGEYGGVVSDEPRASLVASDILSAGGTAADAAVALYFALSVTYPSAAALGGGGVCVVHDARSGKAEALDFAVGPPANPSPRRRFEIGVPGNVRGMYALHARHGRLRWEQVVLPAENLARFGVPVSRALAHELVLGARVLGRDPTARAIFGKEGRVLREGEELRQVELAATLGRIRGKSAGEFYSGLLGRTFVDGVAELHSGLSMSDLRDYRPAWRPTIQSSVGRHIVHFTPDPGGGNAIAARLWAELENNENYRGDTGEVRDSVLAETAVGVYGAHTTVDDRARGRLRNPAMTSFAVVDIAGGAVACSLTMNGRFGAARIVPGTGILTARAPGGVGDGKAALSAMLVVHKFNGSTVFAAGASGSAAAPTSLVSVALRVLVDELPLEEALAEQRFHAGSVPKTLYVERDIDRERIDRLRPDGWRVVGVRRLARINAIHCAQGIPKDPSSCTYRTDRRGFGYAASAGQ